jgi:hypothetical protein
MRVPKWLAVVGFQFCATIFVGLSVYGAALYLTEGLQTSDSLFSSASYAAAVGMSIAGICFFGKEKDRHQAEENRTSSPAPRPAPRKKRR